jgi:hypothetical protein
MIGVLLANASSLTAAPVELVVLIACLALLSVRAVIGVLGVETARRVTHLLSIFIGIFLLLFLLLVILRFKTLG